MMRKSDIPFGYYYNGKELAINRKEAKTVKDIYYFYLSGLNSHDIANLMAGDSLYKVIDNKIFNSLSKIKSYGFKVEIFADKENTVDIEKILMNKKQRENYLLPLLLNLQKRIHKSKSAEILDCSIDTLVTIIENFSEIEDRYINIFERNNDNTITSILPHYSKDDIYFLLNHDTQLVYMTSGEEEFVIEYSNIPDAIIDINNRLGSTDLNVYDYDEPFKLLLSTKGEFLDWCDSDVRKDIIDRLIKLQTNEEEISDYKIISNDDLNKVRDIIYQDFIEM